MLDFDDSYEHVKKTIAENLCVSLSVDSSETSLRTRKTLQHVLRLKFSNQKSQRFYESICAHAGSAEKLCPGAGLIFLKLLSAPDKKISIKSPRTREEVLDVLRALIDDRVVVSMLCTALSLSTQSTKFSIGISSSSKRLVILTDGYTFTAKSLLKTKAELGNSVIACIDGFVESIGEIHHLLETLSQSSAKCVLFVRGMSDDVLNTLKVNNDRKTLCVHPFLVPFDPENVNTLVDVAISSGTDVVSTTKGDLISSVDFSKLGRVERCIVSGDTVKFTNSSTKKRVDEHVASLKKKLEERQELVHVLSRRLKSLTSSCIDILIPDDMSFFSTSSSIDEGIRVISSVIDGSYDPAGIAVRTLESFNRTTSESVYVNCDSA